MNPFRQKNDNFRADYEYTVEGQVICIVDLDRGNRSVTNDIENILHDIKIHLGELSGYAVIYRDSTGRWDGVRQTENGRADFYGLREIDKDKAAERLLHLMP